MTFWKGMVNGQPSKAKARRADASGYQSPSDRLPGFCCARCPHSEVQGERNLYCLHHRHRVHQLGICKEKDTTQ